MRRVPSGIERGNVGGVRTTATGLLANATLRRANGDVHLAGLHAGASGGHTLGDRPGAHGARGGATYAGGREGGGEGGHVVLSAVEGDTRWLDRRSGEERDSFRLQDSAMAGTDASASGRGGRGGRAIREKTFSRTDPVTRPSRNIHGVFKGSQTHIPKIAKTSRASSGFLLYRGHKTR